MAAKESDPGREPASPADARASNEDPERRTENIRYLDTATSQYEEAIVRIRQLEAEIEGLGRQLRDLTGFSEQTDQDRKQDLSTLYARVDSLEKDSRKSRIDSLESTLSGSRDSMPHTKGTGDGTGHPRVDGASSRQRDDELAQLRFQIVNLENQLGQAAEQSNESNGARSSRRHGRTNNAKWQFWRARKRHY